MAPPVVSAKQTAPATPHHEEVTATQRQPLAELVRSVVRRIANTTLLEIPRLQRPPWLSLPSRRWVISLASVALLIFIVRYTPLVSWGHSTLDQAKENMKARAAFRFTEDFTSGISDHWAEEGLVPDESGGARIKGLAFYRQPMAFADVGYRIDFDAKIDSSGVGWFMRASDAANYYAFKLVEGKKRSGKSYRLIRYPVSAGEADASQRTEIDVPAELAEDGFNRISVRVRENRVATFINGTGVDFFESQQVSEGGIGFFTEGKESAVIRQMTVSGNEDSLGLFLFGFLEMIEDAKNFVSPVALWL